jgi:anti-sigma regulatory factor (Ser/Thr protein kinase)
VRHGGCAGKEDAAWVHLAWRNGAVEVDFRDRGVPFDPTEALAPDIHAPIAEGRGAGLGIHLVRQIMEDIAHRREGEWNVLTMKHAAGEPREGQ